MDSELDVLMPQLPAIALDGAKGVGKTAVRGATLGVVLRAGR